MRRSPVKFGCHRLDGANGKTGPSNINLFYYRAKFIVYRIVVANIVTREGNVLFMHNFCTS